MASIKKNRPGSRIEDLFQDGDTPSVNLVADLPPASGIELPSTGNVHTTIGPAAVGFVSIGPEGYLLVLAEATNGKTLVPGTTVSVRQAPVSDQRVPRSIDTLLE